MEKPRRAFQFNIIVDGDTWDYAARELVELARVVSEGNSILIRSEGAFEFEGKKASHSFLADWDDKMTAAKYQRDLSKYLKAVEAL